MDPRVSFEPGTRVDRLDLMPSGANHPGVRAVLQRVRRCHVRVAGEVRASIGPGVLVLLGIARGDDRTDLTYLADKVSNIRIFPDDQGKMNRSLRDVGGSALVVPNFTLAGDAHKGRRPSFDGAMGPERAEAMFQEFCVLLEAAGVPVERGVFGASMHVELVNDGPVTLVIDSPGNGPGRMLGPGAT